MRPHHEDEDVAALDKRARRAACMRNWLTLGDLKVDHPSGLSERPWT